MWKHHAVQSLKWTLELTESFSEFEPSMKDTLIEKLGGLIPTEILQQMALPGKEIGSVHIGYKYY